MFILFQINHTTGAGGFGPASKSAEKLRDHLFQTEGTKWEAGGSWWDRDPTEEEKAWDWFSGASNGGGTTHTAFIRPLEVLEEN